MDATNAAGGIPYSRPQIQTVSFINPQDTAPALPADSFASVTGNPLPVSRNPALMKTGKHAAGPEKLPTVDSATLYFRDDKGNFQTISKIPCDDPDRMMAITGKDGKSHLYFTSGDGKIVNLMSEDGELEMQKKLPGKDSAGQLAFSPEHNSLYVRGGDALYCLDPDSGNVKATLPFQSFGYNKLIFIDKTGQLLFSTEGEVKTLDENLKEMGSVPVGFTPSRMQYLPDGSLLCCGNSSSPHVLISRPDGKSLFEEHNAKSDSTVVTEDGRVYFVRETSPYTRKNTCEVVSYDSSTGKVSKYTAKTNTRSVVPLKNGATIAFDDRLLKPRLTLYSPEGNPVWSWNYKKDGFLRQFFITDDEKTAYLALDRHHGQSGTETERELYRLPLKPERGGMDRLSEAVSSTGSRNNAELVYELKGNSRDFIPGILNDGRIIIFEKDGIHLLSHDGREESTSGSLEDLLKALPRDAEIVARRIKLGSTQESDIPAGADNLLRYAKDVYGGANPSAYSLTPGVSDSGTFPFSEKDCTLNIGKTAGENDALQHMGLKDAQELEGLLAGNTVLNFALKNQIELPFPGSQGKAQVSTREIRVELPAQGGKTATEHFQIREPLFYTTVLPVSTGKNTYVFAATSDGILHWYDAERRTERQSYDLGSGVKKIILKDNRIFAVNVRNGVFILEPALQEGESLTGKVTLSGSHLGVEDPSSTIVDEGEFVVVGGVKLSKNTQMYTIS